MGLEMSGVLGFRDEYVIFGEGKEGREGVTLRSSQRVDLPFDWSMCKTAFHL